MKLLIFLVFVLFAAIVYNIICIKLILGSRVVDTVKKASKRYIYAKNIFDELEPEEIDIKYVFSKNISSKTKLDRMNLERELITLIRENQSVRDAVQSGLRNNQKRIVFNQQMTYAPPHPNEIDIQIQKIKYAKYIRIEDRLVCQLENRIIVPQYEFFFKYTSPKGRNSYQRRITVNVEQLDYLTKQITKEVEYKRSNQYQRNLMSSSLRYDILQRDGFRCTICGRSAKDGIKLHVDHIKPIAKGGKTEWDNLRTLCQDCNLGKKDKFIQNGLN